MAFLEIIKIAAISFFEYQTPKIVHIKSKKVGVLNRIIQLSILIYVICFAIVYKKGYQDFGQLESSATTKVKGLVSPKIKPEDFKEEIDNKTFKYYNRVWDISDIIVPAYMESNAFFVTTNIVITPNQRLSNCPENPTIHPSPLCNSDANCTNGFINILGNGIETGRCVPSDYPGFENKKVCEIKGWCPVERDFLPLKNDTAIFNDTQKFTVLIKNSVKFRKFDIERRNIKETTNKTYLSSCIYNKETDPTCPVFLLGDIVKETGEDYGELAKYGAVIAIEINWNCNFDFSVDNCNPVYAFRRLDNTKTKIAPGSNFRHAHFYLDTSRTLYKTVGITFKLFITGQGGKFSFVPLFINIGSGLGLIAIAGILCDFIVLYFIKGHQEYKEKKYLYVDAVYADDENESSAIIPEARRCKNTLDRNHVSTNLT